MQRGLTGLLRRFTVLNFGVPSGLHSISKFFEFLHSIARLHMGRSLRSAPPKSAPRNDGERSVYNSSLRRISVRVKPGERVRSGWQRSEVHDSNEREGNPRQRTV